MKLTNHADVVVGSLARGSLVDRREIPGWFSLPRQRVMRVTPT